MDKAYTLMYEVDKSGLIAKVSPLIDYSTEQGIIDNFKLPLPDSKKLISVSDQYTINEERISKLVGKEYRALETFDAEYSKWTQEQKQKFLIKLQKELGENETCRLKYVRDAQGNYVKSEILFDFIKDSNKHNSYVPSVSGLKNRMVYHIMSAASSVKNLWASEQPMSADPVNDVIAELEGNSEKLVYDPINPFTKFLFQEFNSVGKDCVGIAANGVKVDGSLQQYFNSLYSGRLQTEYGDIKIDLNFLLPDGNRYLKTFTRFANTRIDLYEKFNELFSTFTPEDFRQFTEYKKIVQALSAINLEEVNANNYLQKAKIIDSIINDSKLAEEILLWGLENPQEFLGFKESVKVASTNDAEYFKRFLYFRILFEDNAADTLSIFISLATDNAKELKLYKINGTRELLSMGLAMVALGVDLKTALSVTKFLLDPVAKYLNRSAFADPSKSSFADVRTAILTVYSEDGADPTTLQSLLKIQTLAAEMNSLSSFYKLNQGVTARYEELLDFLQSLSKLKLQSEKNSDKVIESELYGQPIDIERFVNDSEYQQQLCDYMEQFKVGINVCDVVLKSPAYRAYIEALMWNTGSLKKSCFLANVMDSKVLQGYNSKDNIHRSDLLRAARHYIIGKTLDKMNWILFNKSDLERTYKTSLRGNVSDIINLRSDSLINEFVKFVENHVIPDWKNDEVIGSNYFIRELTKVDNRYKNRSEYTIPYNVMDGDPDTANLINNIQRSFSQIELLSSKLKLAGTNRYLTIGEVVYLYNLLVHENHLGTLSKIANTIKSDLPSYHRQTAIELDNRVRAGEDFSKLFEYFGKLAYASKKGGQSRIFKIGDYEASVNITGSYIWTKAGYTISNILSLNDFVNALEIYDEIQFEETPYKFTSEGVTFYVKNGAPIFIPNTGQFSVNNKIQSISGTFANEVRRLILENNPSIYLILHLGSKKVIVYEEDTLSDNIKHINDVAPILSKSTINAKVLKALIDLNKSLGIAYVDDDEKGNNVQRIYVAKYPGRNYLVLNSSLAKNISLQDSYEFLQLIDVLIQSNLEDEGKTVTIQNKAAKLIEILTDKSNSQKYLSRPNEVEDSLSVKSKELFLSYVNKYLNDIGNSYIADACRIERNGLAQALSMPEIFYKDCVEKYLVKNSVTELIQQGLIKVGDMIAPKLEKDGGKISFLYIGEVAGKYYFVSNAPESMRSLYPQYVVSDRIRYPEVTKFKTLKRSKNDPIGEFTFTDFNYKEKSEKIKADRLYKGFKILRNGESFIVLEAILKGNSVDIIMKSETGNPFLETVDKSTVLTGYGIEGTTTRSEIILGGKNVVINTANNPELLANFIGQILKGSTFKSKGTEYNLLSIRYENDKPSALIGKNKLTGGTEEISVNEIQSVTIPDYKYSRNMLANIVPILFIQLVNAESLRELKIKVLNAEMLTNSYKAHLLYNKLLKIGWVGEFTQKEKGYEIPYKHTVVLNNTNKLMYSFDGMYKVNNPADLYIGDFILQRTNGSDIISEIIDITGDNITLVQHILPYDVQNTGMRGEKSRQVIFMTPSTSIKAAKLSDLESAEMYSYKRKSNILKYVPTQVTSKIEKSKRFIEYLADKFNAKVIYDENASANDNWTAKLTEEGIIINTAKAGDDILRHGVHEFTHLIFADMRMRNPEAYFSMIQAINDMISRNNHKIGEIAQEVKANGEYYSENDIAEEIIVRYLENYSTSLDSSELTEDLVDSEGKLFKLLNTGLSDLFEHMSVNSDEVKMTVGELIKSSLFNSDIQVFNILTLAEDAKLRNLYKLIEYTCK